MNFMDVFFRQQDVNIFVVVVVVVKDTSLSEGKVV